MENLQNEYHAWAAFQDIYRASARRNSDEWRGFRRGWQAALAAAAPAPSAPIKCVTPLYCQSRGKCDCKPAPSDGLPPVGADCWMFAAVAEAIAEHTKSEPEGALVDRIVSNVQDLRRHEDAAAPAPSDATPATPGANHEHDWRWISGLGNGMKICDCGAAERE